ncbi:cysteine peptidase family C39 domain-containing protein [Streptosporangium sp. NPDC002524]|uniref:cysteine peptidase family C39 domain-containing protein n=1 Tax=Streptosporangium sp. NPDC002524 TaxID=3154537 RepID=UPI003320A6C7
MLFAHDVSMCRQLISPAEWEQHGGWVLGDREEWGNRACGAATLRMVTLAYKGEAPAVVELLHLGVKHKALSERGWIHAGLAELATSVGVPARAEAVAPKDLIGAIRAAPLIISVTERLPEDGRKGGHLIVARGYTDAGDILIRDPSGWGQEHDRVAYSRLTSSYTGRAITFAPAQEPARPYASGIASRKRKNPPAGAGGIRHAAGKAQKNTPDQNRIEPKLAA